MIKVIFSPMARQPLGGLGLVILRRFHVMEHGWNKIDGGKPKYSGKKPAPVPLCPPKIPHGLTRD